ncbi:hypothetical protein CDL15_Pgr000661 [Punica granatum]|uniref:J domain-containing protein n=1 Tax=Punica granatum TaxID=22663 RepID=A0A218W3V0_PUNGR|nr:hypothetical protein CDL15_Pgr000661 [Punica granatum]
MGRKKKSRVPSDDGEEEEGLQNENHGKLSEEKSLYELLGVEKTATQQEIKKAYHKLALQLHPDKNPDDEEAKEKFQQLQKVISILGDEEKRALYDQTGCVDDAVTEADIEEFAANYRGSDSEKNDLFDLYKKCKGNMHRLFCSMICSDPKLDSHRFRDMIDEEIAAGRPKKQQSEDLHAIISQRRSERKDKFESMFSSLVNKYGGGEENSSEMTEEEFEAARKRLESRKSSKKSRKN